MRFALGIILCLWMQQLCAQSAIFKWDIPVESEIYHLKSGNKEILVGSHISVMGNDYPMPFIGEVVSDKVNLKTWRNNRYCKMQFAHVLPNGNIVVAGTMPETEGNKTGDKDIYYSMFNSNLEFLYSKKLNKKGNEILYSLGVNPDNEILLHYCSTVGLNPCSKISTKVSEDGNIIWSRDILSSGTWGGALALKDGGQLVYNNGNHLVCRLNKNGDLAWVKALDFWQYYAVHAVEHASGDLYICYEKTYASSNHYYVVVKFDAQGNYSEITSNAINTSRVIGMIPTAAGVHVFFNANAAGINSTFRAEYNASLAATGAFFTTYDSANMEAYYLRSSQNSGQISFSNFSNFRSTTTSPSADGLPACNIRGTLFPNGFIRPNVFNTALSPSPINLSNEDIPHEYFQPMEYNATVHCRVCDTLEPSVFVKLEQCQDNLLLSGSDAENYEWSTNETSQSITVSKSGRYILKRFNACDVAFDTFDIVLYPLAKVRIGLSPVNPDPNDRLVFYSVPYRSKAKYAWNIGSNLYLTDTVLIPSIKRGRYQVYLQVIDSNGCEAKDSIHLTITDFKVWFPNAFSPDKNGNNDRFGPSGIGFEYFELSIYNRWGEELYSGNSAWDGMGKGEALASGVYVYTCTVIDLLGQAHEAKGTVHLIK